MLSGPSMCVSKLPRDEAAVRGPVGIVGEKQRAGFDSLCPSDRGEFNLIEWCIQFPVLSRHGGPYILNGL